MYNDHYDYIYILYLCFHSPCDGLFIVDVYNLVYNLL